MVAVVIVGLSGSGGGVGGRCQLMLGKQCHLHQSHQSRGFREALYMCVYACA